MPETVKPSDGAAPAAQNPQQTAPVASGSRVEVDLTPVLNAMSGLKSEMTEQMQKLNKKVRSQRAEIAALKARQSAPADEADDAEDADDLDDTPPKERGGQQNTNPYEGMAIAESIVDEMKRDDILGYVVQNAPNAEAEMKRVVYEGLAMGLPKEILRARAIACVHDKAIPIYRDAEAKRKTEAAAKPPAEAAKPSTGEESVVNPAGTAGGGAPATSGLVTAVPEGAAERMAKLGVPVTALPKKRKV